MRVCAAFWPEVRALTHSESFTIEIVLHQATGNVYAACSTQEGRLAWMPALHNFNASARSRTDYIAVYDARPPRRPRGSCSPASKIRVD